MRESVLDFIAIPLANVSRQHVEDALASFRDTMNCIQKYYKDSSTLYEHPVEAPGGIEALVFFLEKGLAVEAERLASRLRT